MFCVIGTPPMYSSTFSPVSLRTIKVGVALIPYCLAVAMFSSSPSSSRSSFTASVRVSFIALKYFLTRIQGPHSFLENNKIILQNTYDDDTAHQGSFLGALFLHREGSLHHQEV